MLTRRELLTRCSTGFGAVALAGLLDREVGAAPADAALPESAALRAFHHPPQAKRVVFCFMSGGVSHLDSFDPKPRLEREAGKAPPFAVARTMFNNNGALMPSPFRFAPAGESGLPVSEIFPHLAAVADELAVVRSMTSPVNEHATANYFLHTGFPFQGHPSAGAWTTYGLGSENENLPGFVVLQSGSATAPLGGVGLYSGGYLPGRCEGSILRADGVSATGPEPVRNIRPRDADAVQRSQLAFLERLDGAYAAATADDRVEAAIRNYETAYRMQTEAPAACDLAGETEATHRLYGTDADDPELAAYARQCLLARRLVERGVRFIELSCLTKGIGAGNAGNPWDQHGDLERGHRAMARQVDQPIAALIRDLRDRGLLDETLIVWAGEFGRTPFSQGSNGRDHNPGGFSVWLAGGGVKGGTAYGATDDYGYQAVEHVATLYDLWATVLRLLGVDHERLTYRYGGRDFRLTDVHGNVLRPILK